MSRKSRFLLTVIVVVIGLTTMASVCEPCPPTPDCCSPGYWKNHLGVWEAAAIADGGDPVAIMADLRAKGGAGSGRPLREGAAAYLNGLGLGANCND